MQPNTRFRPAIHLYTMAPTFTLINIIYKMPTLIIKLPYVNLKFVLTITECICYENINKLYNIFIFHKKVA